MKTRKRSLSFVLALLLLCALAPSVLAASDGPAYWNERRAAASNPDWMASLPGDTPIRAVSIPGTHDTMAYSGGLLLKDIVHTQSMTLQQQLQSGIRYLDIRLEHRGNRFDIYHGIIYLNASFDDVLNTVSRFLKEHPGETILMRLKQEGDSATAQEMTELFQQYVKRYPGLFYNGGKSNPTLAELRGQVFLLHKTFDNLSYGVPYTSLDCQDDYDLSSPLKLYGKWESIKAQLLRAGSGNALYLNHLTGSGGVLPYFVSSGKLSSGTYAPQLATGVIYSGSSSRYPDFPRRTLPFGLKAIEYMGMNQLTAEYITAQELKAVGIIAADFPGAALINAVIGCNFR